MSHDHHFGQPEEPGLRFASSAPSRLHLRPKSVARRMGRAERKRSETHHPSGHAKTMGFAALRSALPILQQYWNRLLGYSRASSLYKTIGECGYNSGCQTQRIPLLLKGCCGAAPSATGPGTCAPRTGTGTSPRTGTGTTAFAVCVSRAANMLLIEHYAGSDRGWFPDIPCPPVPVALRRTSGRAPFFI